MDCFKLKNWIQDYKNKLDYCSDVEEQLLKNEKKLLRGGIKMSKIKKMSKSNKKEQVYCDCNDSTDKDTALEHLKSEYVFWKKTMDEAVSLIDAVTDIVAIYKPKSPAQSDWKSAWLNAANKVLRIYDSNKDDDVTEPKKDEWENEESENKELEDKVFYYHLRDYTMKPMVTVCIMRTDGIYTRGVSICSLKEMPVKAVGRELAADRAIQALRTEASELPVYRDEADEVLEQVEGSPVFEFKSEYSPNLTVFERRLFGLDYDNVID